MTRRASYASGGRSRTPPTGTSGAPRSVEAVALACQLVGRQDDALAQNSDQFVDLRLGHDERRRHHVEMADRTHDEAARLAVIRDALADIDLIRQRLFRLAVGHVLDAQHEM